MSMQKPYNINVRGATFDANEDIVVSWKTSGDVSTGFSISVFLNLDDSLVWTSGNISSYGQQYAIPRFSLINGKEYKIQVTVTNQSNESATSELQIFQTSSRPVVTLSSVGVIGSQSYEFSATYLQTEQVSMKSYIAFLYGADRILLAQSNILTEKTLSYMFSALQSGSSYFVEFQATSSKGLIGTSGLVPIRVQYSQPTVNVNLKATNVDNAGVKLSWNVIQIIGHSTNAVFVGNEKLDVKNGKVWFDDGFSIDKDFTLKLWIESPVPDKDILTLKGDNGSISLQYWADDQKFHLFKLNNNGISAHYASPMVNGSSYFVCIQQIGDNLNCIAELNA